MSGLFAASIGLTFVRYFAVERHYCNAGADISSEAAIDHPANCLDGVFPNLTPKSLDKRASAQLERAGVSLFQMSVGVTGRQRLRATQADGTHRV
jgi:hypothetical protein